MANQYGQTTNRTGRHPIFEIMKARGITQSWLARQWGIDRQYVTQMKYGDRPIPAEYREQAAVLFGLPESVLFLPEMVGALTDSVSIQESAR